MKKATIQLLFLIYIVFMLSISANAVDESSNGGPNGHWSAYNENVVAVEQLGGNIYLGQTTTGTFLVIGSDHTILEATIPEHYDGKPIVAIGQGAFADCPDLETVYIPSRVDSICAGAFYNTPKLKKFTVSEKNPTYFTKDGVLFERAKANLTLHTYPAGNDATGYEIPNGVTSIANFAFSHAKLNSLTLPSTVGIIYHAFQNAEIENFEFFGHESQWILMEKYCSEDIANRVHINRHAVPTNYPTIVYPDLSGPKNLSAIRKYKNGELAEYLSFQYDKSNHLIEYAQYTADGLVTDTESYAYDADGRLLSVLVTGHTNPASPYSRYFADIYRYDHGNLVYSEHNNSEVTRVVAEYEYDANNNHIKTIYSSYRDVEGLHSQWEWTAEEPQTENEWVSERFTANLICGLDSALQFTDSEGHSIWELKESYDSIQYDSEGKIMRLITADGFIEFIYENEEVIRLVTENKSLHIGLGTNIELLSYHYLDGEQIDADNTVYISDTSIVECDSCEYITVYEPYGTCCTVQRNVFLGKSAGTAMIRFTDSFTQAAQEIEIVVEEIGTSEAYPALTELANGLILENLLLHDIHFKEQSKYVQLECNAFNSGEEAYWLQAYDSNHNIVEEIKLLPKEKCGIWEHLWNELLLLPAERAAAKGQVEAQKYVLANKSMKTPVTIHAPYNGELLIVDGEGNTVFEILIPKRASQGLK